MAGDWIKIEHGLLNKPEVMLLADALDRSHFEAVGHLIAFWLWVDLNMSPSCPQVKGTKKGLDRVAGRDGFADALISVGWLDIESDMISIPGYEVHLSKSAKERAKGQKKKASQRSKVSPNEGDKQGDKNGTQGGTREEKRREENINTPLPPKGEPSKSSKRKPKATQGQWIIPEGMNKAKILEALGHFEEMRRSKGKPIANRENLSRIFPSFDDEAHLLYAITFATANEYQGIKVDYRPPLQPGKPIRRESDLPVIDANWEPA